jgi:hypothetical protein
MLKMLKTDSVREPMTKAAFLDLLKEDAAAQEELRVHLGNDEMVLAVLHRPAISRYGDSMDARTLLLTNRSFVLVTVDSGNDSNWHSVVVEWAAVFQLRALTSCRTRRKGEQERRTLHLDFARPVFDSEGNALDFEMEGERDEADEAVMHFLAALARVRK